MGVAIPGAGYKPSAASGAQVIDGGLNFNQGSTTATSTIPYLTYTPGSSGNRSTWSVSCWAKPSTDSSGYMPFIMATDDEMSWEYEGLFWFSNNLYYIDYISNAPAFNVLWRTTAEYRDTAWYHIMAVKVDNSTFKLYVNGEEVTHLQSATNNGAQSTWLNSAAEPMYIGGYIQPSSGTGYSCRNIMSQFYFIDGEALEPSDFGYTDPLTNTWRPKKYTGDYNISAGGESIVSGATLLTWDDSPIGSVYTLTNSNKTATAGGGGSGYGNADAWSIAIPANTTYAWTFDVINGDTAGGWYFTDSQTDSNTHPDERGGNSLGLRGGETSAGCYGTFAAVNGDGSSGQDKITLSAAVDSSGPGVAKKVDFVVYRPSSGTGKVWVRGHGDGNSWIGGGDPTNTSSTASFIIPDGTTYFGFTAYDRSAGNQILTFETLETPPTGINSLYLPMDGNAPIGKDLSKLNPINDGRMWSSYISGTEYNSSQAKGFMFNGSTTGQFLAAASSSVTITFPGSGLHFSSSLRIMAQVTSGSTDIVFNWSGGSHTETISAVGAVWWDLSSHVTSPLTSITWTSQSGTTGPYINALEVDGIILHEDVFGNSWTPVNFGGSNVIPKATGALPILNTVNGGNVATVGVRTDTSSTSLVLALPLVGVNDDVSNRINSGTTTKVMTSVGTAAASTLQSNFYGGSFLFDGNSDYLTTPASSDFNFADGNYTIEWWQWWNSITGYQAAFDCGYTDVDSLLVQTGSGTGKYQVYAQSDTVFEESSAAVVQKWTHYALVRNGTSIKLYRDGAVSGSGTHSGSTHGSSTHTFIVASSESGYEFNGYMQDFRVYKGVAKYTSDFIPASTNPDILPETPSGVALGSNLTKVTDGAVTFDGVSDYLLIESNSDLAFGTGDFTFEFWVYMSTDQYTIFFDMRPNSAASQGLYPTIYLNSGTSLRYYTDSADRITGDDMVAHKWYHVAVSRSGTSTKMFLNGVQQGSTYSDSNNYLNGDTTIGCRADGSTGDLDGYMSNVRVVKGTALYTADFTPPTAPLTAVTNTKLLCCQSNRSATHYEVSPGAITANGAVATNFNPFNTDINTVMGQETGYATFNPFATGTYASDRIFTDGNLRMLGRGDARSNLGVTSGKFYAEVYVEKYDNPDQGYIGLISEPDTFLERAWPSAKIVALRDNAAGGDTLYGDGKTSTTTTWTQGDLLSVAFDADAAKVWIGKNGNWINGGNPATVDTPLFAGITFKDYYFLVSDNEPSSNPTTAGNIYQINFGQKPFKYAPPEGYKPLNYANLPSPGVVRPAQYVGISTWTGAGTTDDRVISTIQPDLIWSKTRTVSAYHNNWFDSVRNFGVQNALVSDSNGAAGAANGGRVKSVNGNGITWESGGGAYAAAWYNESKAYVSWYWKAGGNPGISTTAFWTDDKEDASAAAAGLTAGTITPTGASVGTKPGFSIIKYRGNGVSGATLSHGLSQAPDCFIIKSTEYAYNWNVYHKSMGNTHLIRMNQQTGKVTESGTAWNDTSPTSSVITFGNLGGTNMNTAEYIAYIWHDVPGLQKFGSYNGNNSAAGPYVELGFRPALLIIKNVDATNPWIIRDSVRDPYNSGTSAKLAPNFAYMENNTTYIGTSTQTLVDFLSNGFRVRSTGGISNDSGVEYLYMAWAYQPMNNLYGGQANAR